MQVDDSAVPFKQEIPESRVSTGFRNAVEKFERMFLEGHRSERTPSGRVERVICDASDPRSPLKRRHPRLPKGDDFSGERPPVFRSFSPRST